MSRNDRDVVNQVLGPQGAHHKAEVLDQQDMDHNECEKQAVPTKVSKLWQTDVAPVMGHVSARGDVHHLQDLSDSCHHDVGTTHGPHL